ncbi:hypothetical protein M2284_002721 [Rhodococcus sp. LBL1]|nr:hypothetical protein [Rhodococcus sp. LBL1]MDH6684105.1 hypothetical protein [Rhodococcus sp. LBL2]
MRVRRAVAEICARVQGVETVEAARPDLEFGLAAGRPDAGGVVDVLVAEDFGGAGVDVGGRQAGEVVGERWRNILGHFAGGEVAEDGTPSELVHLAGPDAGHAGVLVAGRAGVAVIEHGADQNLGGDRRGTAVAGQQGDTGCEATARTDAGDDDPLGVDAQFGRMFGDPAQSLVAVLDEGGAGRFGREPVVHGHHHRAELVEPVQRDVDLREAVAHHHPAAVHPVDTRRHGRAVGVRGAEDGQRDRGTVRRGHRDLAPVDLSVGEQ